MKTTFNRYEYPIKDTNGQTYRGSYTIKKGVKPLGYTQEKLVQTFTTEIIDFKKEWEE